MLTAVEVPTQSLKNTQTIEADPFRAVVLKVKGSQGSLSGFHGANSNKRNNTMTKSVTILVIVFYTLPVIKNLQAQILSDGALLSTLCP